MKKRFNTAPNWRKLIGSLAAVLLVTAGISGATAWAEGSADGKGAGRVLDGSQSQSQSQSEVDVRASVRCPECGVVESMRVIEQPREGDDSGPPSAMKKMGRSEGLTRARKTIRIAEVTLRMNDGASHRFIDTNPANWRPGERVIFIEGMRIAR